MLTEQSTSAAWDSQLLVALSALKNGDLTVRLPTGQGGTAGQIAEAYNGTVEQLNQLVAESLRIAHELGREGKYAGQIMVDGLDGRWATLRDEVNDMANTLTVQIRNMSQVIAGLLNGEPGVLMTAPAATEMLDLKNAINQLVARLGTVQESS
jgi:methyl-accepting chemotaxis protein